MKDYRNLTNKEAWEEFNKLTPDEIIRECQNGRREPYPREGKGWRTTEGITYFTDDCRGFFLCKDGAKYWMIYMGGKGKWYWDVLISEKKVKRKHSKIDPKLYEDYYLKKTIRVGPLCSGKGLGSYNIGVEGMVLTKWEKEIEDKGEVRFMKGNMHDITDLLFPRISSFINWANENPLEVKE